MFGPYGSATTNPSSVKTACTGVSYGRPVVRPTCRMTDAMPPGVPLDFNTNRFVARPLRRTALRTGGDFARIPATKTIPITETARNRPPTSMAILRPMCITFRTHAPVDASSLPDEVVGRRHRDHRPTVTDRQHPGTPGRRRGCGVGEAKQHVAVAWFVDWTPAGNIHSGELTTHSPASPTEDGTQPSPT